MALRNQQVDGSGPPVGSSDSEVRSQPARTLYAENLRLRELLVAVAQELERIASEDQEVPGRDRLLRRAMRIRQQLHR